MTKIDIFITGVGGQGSLTASEFLGEAACRAGLNVLVGELHGMAQRGGVVETMVRIGDIYGPIISDGRADVLLGFEPVETVRILAKANRETLVITNLHPVVPSTLSIKGASYPDIDGLLELIRQTSPRVISLDATEFAKQAGSVLAVNTIMLGVLAGTGVLPFKTQILKDIIKERTPARFIDVNIRAFAMGIEYSHQGTLGVSPRKD